jgi:hypothetical protein
MAANVAGPGLLAHRRLRREVEALVDGELSPADAARVAAHVRGCWGCSGAAQTHRLLRAALPRTRSVAATDLAAVRLRRFVRVLGGQAASPGSGRTAATDPPFGVLAHRTPGEAVPTVAVWRPSGAPVRRIAMTAPTQQTSAASGTALVRRITAGVAGGLAGGVVFGLLMQMMGMIPMVAQLVGSTSVAVGWVVHLVISAVIGGGFGLVGARFLTGTATAVVAGGGYGVVWWVLGPLLLMPARLGMPLFTVDAMAWKSLMGHVIFGVVLGAVAALVTRRGVNA